MNPEAQAMLDSVINQRDAAERRLAEALRDIDHLRRQLRKFQYLLLDRLAEV